ncbi:alpha/beta-hydrolase [Aspergillus uvarum CBS 121591]|uniref:Alpha/beta-hydrolase n=1 Tax=Aspergillus uvarum CBS 121591 TaxID=1448315 RepID=A0A319CPG8_9EURO|nr:alpha/beta-hydrolase [Aspergillus uvarum CBS 121591]PYH77388.1 alpha/beta-hydrolase [Aspergillus uvarum CBS 121591]
MIIGDIMLSVVKYGSLSAAIAVGLYAVLLGLLTRPGFQAHVVYLHAVQMTWFKDLTVPESFGFLHNQVTPFFIPTPDGHRLFAWHILPLSVYHQNERALLSEDTPGVLTNTTTRHAFHLLSTDPDAILVLHFHGAGGTVGSGYRVPNYRALAAGYPAKNIHVLTFDYRGFGLTNGSPSESGLIIDALAVVDWAMNVANIPPHRILLFGQSLGTAVTLAVAQQYARQSPPVAFKGIVLVAPFVDVPTLVSTYRVAGTVPILSPLARFPSLFQALQGFIRDQWSSGQRIAEFIHASEANSLPYRLTVIHAEDDDDIPWWHARELIAHGVRASGRDGVEEADMKVDLGASGTIKEWRSTQGVIREEILKTGLHDVIMGNAVVSMAVMRSLEGV